MTTSTEAVPLGAGELAVAVSPRCAVCDHEVSSHDAIGLRYCQATQAKALPRGCICTS